MRERGGVHEDEHGADPGLPVGDPGTVPVMPQTQLHDSQTLLIRAAGSGSWCQTCAKAQIPLESGVRGLRVPTMNPPPVPSAATTRSALGLTASQAARHLGVSLSTVRRWSDTGHLRGYRTPGGQRRFSPDQLDAFLRSLQQPD